MNKLAKVWLSNRARKQLAYLPQHILKNLFSWVDAVEHEGLIETRKCAGYHDEPLKGNRIGERSIRLSRAYRACYVSTRPNGIDLITILEVTKHEY